MALVVSGCGQTSFPSSFLFHVLVRRGRKGCSHLTISLNSEVHFTLRGVGDGVAAEFDLGAAVNVSVSVSLSFLPLTIWVCVCVCVCVSQSTAKSGLTSS